MAPNMDAILISFIKQSGVQFTSNLSKIAALVHAYCIISECTLIGLGQPPRTVGLLRFEGCLDAIEQAPEIELSPNWADEDLVQLYYRTPDKKLLEVKSLAVGDRAIVHWCRCSDILITPAIKSVEVDLQKYLADGNDASTAFNRPKLSELVNMFSVGLDCEIWGSSEAHTSTTCAADGSRRTSIEAAPEYQRRCREDNGGWNPLPVGHNDRLPAGMGGSLPGYGGGGSQMGPNDPLFSSRLPSGTSLEHNLPPGARFDPIGPPGVPGFHPGDFTGEQARQEGWHDIGPPPGGMPFPVGRSSGPAFSGPGLGRFGGQM